MNVQVESTKSAGPEGLPETLAVLAQRGHELFGERPAVRWRVADGSWQQASYTEVWVAAEEIARGLIALGLEPGDRVATQTKLRPEWTCTFLATAMAGFVLATVLSTTVPDEIDYVLDDSGARLLICENAEQLAKIRAARPELEDIENIVVIDPSETTGDVMSLAELRELGRQCSPDELTARNSAVQPDDLVVILYTSGTSGAKKGCALTHRNYVSAIRSQRAAKLGAGYGTIFMTNLTTTVAMVVQTMGLMSGFPLAYRSGTGLDEVLAEVVEVQASYLLLAPMILEKFYAAALAALPEPERSQATETSRFGLRIRQMRTCGEPVPPDLQQRFDDAERTIFGPVRSIFGASIKRVQVSGAAISRDILEFFAGCGLLVLEGYALTETTGAAVVNRPDDYRLGSVGRPIPGVEVAIAPDGEVLIRGENVFRGYWGRVTLDGACAVRDGWLHTGDLGELDEDGFLTLVGRSKDVINLNNGMGILPSELESIVRQSSLIANFVLYGEGKPHLVAVVTLDERHASAWAAEHRLPAELSKLVREPELIRHLSSEIQVANSQVQDYCRAKAFTVLDRDLSVDEGELTLTLKTCRPVVHEHFRDRLEALYH